MQLVGGGELGSGGVRMSGAGGGGCGGVGMLWKECNRTDLEVSFRWNLSDISVSRIAALK